ncbi:thioesterase domain-containing protein [Granulicella aggregans]|uniref:Thioesterase domain-containing protein n=1 Tax=Granulicella aggregans TaxID=474949 RepID=A0A7W8E4A1_9BACT|nr:thioesterase domain-containing protein [Granulicella aggregans]
MYLPGAGGGGEGDLAELAAGLDFPVSFEPVRYPGWQRSMAEGFSAEILLEELAAEIERKVPSGPIRIMGMSIGGHLGYTIALRLQAKGREIAGLCVVDSFMIESSKATAGWQGRALAQGMDLLRKGRYMTFARFIRSKAWRGLLRLGGKPLLSLVGRVSGSGGMNTLLARDAMADQELSMRLLIVHLAPWLKELDCEPVPLIAPVALLRTKVSARDDLSWMRRCPYVSIYEVPGTHETLFEAENIGEMRKAFGAAAMEFSRAGAAALETPA